MDRAPCGGAEGWVVKSLFEFADVYLHRLPVDGRKGIDGLATIVQEGMKQDPFGRGLFVFINRRRDRIRLLYWDRSGFAMWMKRLEEERFRWPLKLEEEVISFTPQQLSWLLDGLDVMRMKPHAALNFSAVS